jgi:hypothetical protein
MFWMGYPSVTMWKGSSKPMQGPSPQGFVNLILMAHWKVSPDQQDREECSGTVQGRCMVEGLIKAHARFPPQGFVNLILMAQFNVFKRWLKGQICKILRDNILFFFSKKNWLVIKAPAEWSICRLKWRIHISAAFQ